MAVEFADHQRPDAERVAGADQRLVGQGDERVGALQLAQRLDEALDHARLAAARHEVEDHFRVGGRLVDRPVADERAAQRQAVGKVAVVRHRDAAGVEFREQRLHVAKDRLAGGGVADVADRRVAGQAGDGGRFGEMIADESEPTFGIEAGAVKGDDAGRLLAAVLQGMETERGYRRGVGMAEDPEHPAFFAEAVGLRVKRILVLVARCLLLVAGHGRVCHEHLAEVSRVSAIGEGTLPIIHRVTTFK